MAEVSAANLQDDTLGVLTRVVNGEDLRVTIDGQAVALLRPLERPETWMKRDDFVRRFAGRQADSALTGELQRFSTDTGGDLALP
jgi:antitoxin (DNA-binding transcriptional repressor) of toxin-antitoxin stability system